LKAWLTKRPLTLLLKSALAQWLQTERTREMLRMELFIHSGDATAVYRHLTRVAQAAALQMVVYLAIRHVLVLEETCRVECRAAVLNRKNK
jgi:hypothetical protein